MTLRRLLHKRINERALRQLDHAKPTPVRYEAQEAAKVSLAPVYMQEVPRQVSMVAYNLAQASTAFDISQYRRKSTYLEVRYEDKYHYEKVNILLKDVDFSPFMEGIV